MSGLASGNVATVSGLGTLLVSMPKALAEVVPPQTASMSIGMEKSAQTAFAQGVSSTFMSGLASGNVATVSGLGTLPVSMPKALAEVVLPQLARTFRGMEKAAQTSFAQGVSSTFMSGLASGNVA